MSGNGNFPKPKPAVGSASLSRPDWASGQARNPDMLWLDKNENIDPALNLIVGEVARDVLAGSQNAYPDSASLYERLAAFLGVGADQLCLAAGSDGAIRSVFEAFISPGDGVLRTNPTFAMYGVYGLMFAAAEICVEYRPGDDGPWLDLEELIDAIKRSRPKLVCLPNPDSPTGTVLDPPQLERVAAASRDAGALCLIDEAYHPFHEITAIPLLGEFDNLVIVRSTGKAWGMAGFRIGYAIASPKLSGYFHKVKGMYETGAVAMAVFEGMLDREDAVLASVRRLNGGKDHMIDAMRASGFKTHRGAGNFFHIAFGDRAQPVHEALADLVYYRHDFSHPCLAGFSRFTSAPAEMLDPVIGRIKSSIRYPDF